jgi:hypothetical protein
MPDTHLAPVDTSVVLPPSVVRAAAAAAELHKQAYQPATPQPSPPSPQPDPAPVAPSPQPDPAPQPQPQAQPQPAPQPAPQPEPDDDSVTPDQWRHRYLSMKGRYEAAQVNLGQMQEMNSQLADELMRAQPTTQPQPQQQQRQQRPQPIIRRVTPDDVKTYGPELIDLVQRAAVDAVAPEIQKVSQETQQTRQQITQTAKQAMFAALDTLVPTWKAININPRFKEWCRKPDVYSGMLRGQLLNNAVAAADAPRAAAFFNGFLAEEQATGQAPAPQSGQQASQPPRQAAVALEALAAPGRPKPAAGSVPASAADKPIYTRAQITWFYSQAGRAYYAGREDERKSDEQSLFLAQREGRVR